MNPKATPHAPRGGAGRRAGPSATADAPPRYDSITWGSIPVGPEHIIARGIIASPKFRWWHRFWPVRGRVIWEYPYPGATHAIVGDTAADAPSAGVKNAVWRSGDMFPYSRYDHDA